MIKRDINYRLVFKLPESVERKIRENSAFVIRGRKNHALSSLAARYPNAYFV